MSSREGCGPTGVDGRTSEERISERTQQWRSHVLGQALVGQVDGAMARYRRFHNDLNDERRQT